MKSEINRKVMYTFNYKQGDLQCEIHICSGGKHVVVCKLGTNAIQWNEVGHWEADGEECGTMVYTNTPKLGDSPLLPCLYTGTIPLSACPSHECYYIAA